MKITKEDAHRLITDLPKYYELLKEEVLVNKNGKLLRIPAIEVKEVVLGMLEVNKKVTVAFVSPKDNRLKILLMDRLETKRAIEFWYNYVKTRRKSIAELSIYTDVNKILEERSKIDIQKIVEDVKKLNQKVNELNQDFGPVDVTHLSEEAIMKIYAKVTELSNNRYEVIVEEDGKGKVLAYIFPLNTGRDTAMLHMVNRKDPRILLKLIGLHIDYIFGFSSIIHQNDDKVTISYIMSGTTTQANIFKEALRQSIMTLFDIRERFEKDFKKYNDVINSVKKEYS